MLLCTDRLLVINIRADIYRIINVRTSQYLTQIVKCRKEKCCPKPRITTTVWLQTDFVHHLRLLRKQTKESEWTDGTKHVFLFLFMALSVRVEIFFTSQLQHLVLSRMTYCSVVQLVLAYGLFQIFTAQRRGICLIVSQNVAQCNYSRLWRNVCVWDLIPVMEDFE